MISAEGYQCIQMENAIPVELKGCVEYAIEHIDRCVDQCHASPVIVGNSMGALIALEYMTRYEDRLGGIIMSGSPGISEINVGVSIGDLRSGDIEKARILGNRVFYNQDKVPEDGIEEVARLFGDKRIFLNIARWLSFSRNYDVNSSISKTNKSILMVWGGNDEITPVNDWIGVAESSSNTELDIISECGHSPMIEKPGAFAERMLSAVRSGVFEKSSAQNVA